MYVFNILCLFSWTKKRLLTARMQRMESLKKKFSKLFVRIIYISDLNSPTVREWIVEIKRSVKILPQNINRRCYI